MIHLVFILDITGSMCAELEGVKQTVARLVRSVFSQPVELRVTIVTFTEDARGCFVTKHSFTDGCRVRGFVEKIELCKPPGLPHAHSAAGGDHPENQKAALAQLLTMKAELPTIAFLITDAAPHLVVPSSVASAETLHEIAWLKAKHGVTNPDLFSILDRIKERFDDRLVLNVIKYVESDDHALYAAVAKCFGGVLISPVERSPEALASGLVGLLTHLFRGFAKQQAEPVTTESIQSVKAFRFFDLTTIQSPRSEAELWINASPVAGAADQLLFNLVKRTTAIVGSRFLKRSIRAVNVMDQIRLLLVVARGLVGLMPREDVLKRAQVFLDRLHAVAARSHEYRAHFKLSIEHVRDLLDEMPSEPDLLAGEDASTSMLSFMTVKEAIEFDAADEHALTDPHAQLLSVARLFVGHLAVLQLPSHLGVPDFMDAWSARVTDVSNDVLSVADYLVLLGDEEASVGGLSQRNKSYNYLQLMADRRDGLASALLRAASGTQLLDLLAALVAGAPTGTFGPNMFRGTSAACLLSMLAHDEPRMLREYQWKMAFNMAHTIRVLIVGGSSASSERALEMDPESAPGRLLFRLVRLLAPAARQTTAALADTMTVMRAFFEEFAASRVQRFVKYDTQGYHELVEAMLGYAKREASGGSHHALLDHVVFSFDVEVAVRVVRTSAFAKAFYQSASNLLRVLLALDESKEPAFTVEELWPAWREDLVRLLLLQKRTERYVSQRQAAKALVWRRRIIDAGTDVMQLPLNSLHFQTLAHRVLVAAKRDEINRVLTTRAAQKDSELRQRVEALVLAPVATFVSELASTIGSSSSREYKLLLQALRRHSATLSQDGLQAKLCVLVTGRVNQRVIFDRGNLHPHPDRVMPLDMVTQSRLRGLQQANQWSLSHHYRESNKPNRSGHCIESPSPWAAKRSLEATTFWEVP
ncbi:hypothetical protein ATCC90586_007947 [Pythium insidiosum]|nr:hypothetical protein ATCC90586_007947 [Pythium insidiosum]